MPIVLLFLAALCVGLLVLFNTGQVVSKKTQLVQTADATAYSVAVSQARALNFAAYMNRAEVANEVAVAQIVSIYSWMNFAQTGATNMSVAAKVAGALLSEIGIGVVLLEMSEVLDEINSVLNQVRHGARAAFEAIVTSVGALNFAYSEAAKASVTQVHLYADGDLVARRTVEANNRANADAGMQLSASTNVVLLGQVRTLAGYFPIYKILPNGPGGTMSESTQTPGGERLKNVVMQARDPYTRARSQRIGGSLLLIRASLTMAGGTDLQGYHRWAGMDTFRFLIEEKRPTWSGFKWKTALDLPLAWGAAQAVAKSGSWSSYPLLPGINNGRGWSSPYDNKRYTPYNGAGGNGFVGRLAAIDPAGSDSPDNALLRDRALQKDKPRLQEYPDTSNDPRSPIVSARASSTSDWPIVSVEVEQALDALHTSTHLEGMGAGQFTVPETARGDKLRAVASAQVYFARPRTLFARADGKRELANLFSPYWQVRLVDTPAAVKAQFLALDGIAP
ncbi:pilus assembly protein TadG-related protein [Dyella solisilvae]|nr:pilus assembly protein TadG-related protein [Dyella solisilvae]